MNIRFYQNISPAFLFLLLFQNCGTTGEKSKHAIFLYQSKTKIKIEADAFFGVAICKNKIYCTNFQKNFREIKKKKAFQEHGGKNKRYRTQKKDERSQ